MPWGKRPQGSSHISQRLSAPLFREDFWERYKVTDRVHNTLSRSTVGSRMGPYVDLSSSWRQSFSTMHSVAVPIVCTNRRLE